GGYPPGPGEADHGARDVHGGGGGGREIAQVAGLRVAPRDDPPPPAVAEVLVRQRVEGGAGPVGDPELRGEPDEPAGGPDAVVQLPVLGDDHGLVVAADPLDRVAAVHPEVDRIGGGPPAPRVGGGPAPPPPRRPAPP